MHFLSLQNQCRRRNKHTYDAICFCDLCEATSGFVALIYTFHQLVAFQLCINHRILQHIELRWLRSVNLQHLPVLAFLVFPNNIKPLQQEMQRFHCIQQQMLLYSSSSSSHNLKIFNKSSSRAKWVESISSTTMEANKTNSRKNSRGHLWGRSRQALWTKQGYIKNSLEELRQSRNENLPFLSGKGNPDEFSRHEMIDR